MMPVRFSDGLPVAGERPVVVVAVRFSPAGQVAAVRSDVRWLADEGWSGIWLPETGGELAEVAKDAARRAGIAVICGPGGFGDEPHVLAVEPDAVAVDSAVEAFERCFAGQRVIVGQESAVDGLRQFIALADEVGTWSSRPAPDGWVCRGSDREQGWFSATGAELTIDVPLEFDGVTHLVDPELGEILGVVTPTPGEPLVIRALEAPLAIYCGPNRYAFDAYVTSPEF